MAPKSQSGGAGRFKGSPHPEKRRWHRGTLRQRDDDLDRRAGQVKLPPQAWTARHSAQVRVDRGGDNESILHSFSRVPASSTASPLHTLKARSQLDVTEPNRPRQGGTFTTQLQQRDDDLDRRAGQVKLPPQAWTARHSAQVRVDRGGDNESILHSFSRKSRLGAEPNLGYKSTTHAGRSASDRYTRLKQRKRASSAASAFPLKQRPGSASTNAAPIATGTAAEESFFGDEESPSSEQPAVQHLAGHETPEEPSCLECSALQDNAATVQCHLQVDLQNNQASACMTDKEVTADLLSAHISSLEEENRRLQHDLASAHSRLAKAVPGDRNVFRSNPDIVLFYTGLPNYAVLEAVYSLVEPHVRHTLRNRLNKFEEMVVFLMRLRLNLPLQDLAYRQRFLDL
ncbi:uncharacterized protein LOC119433844 [Dermacentor silvarum]|uniref:uncharacterized protein LOC119433844 n=1 Tax=Dermacentor silvarum TaxID=543639 RepID=UPI0021012267|nr:uncharacterized protein LOC119433844 [Dermacentor silvarum]